MPPGGAADAPASVAAVPTPAEAHKRRVLETARKRLAALKKQKEDARAQRLIKHLDDYRTKHGLGPLYKHQKDAIQFRLDNPEKDMAISWPCGAG